MKRHGQQQGAMDQKLQNGIAAKQNRLLCIPQDTEYFERMFIDLRKVTKPDAFTTTNATPIPLIRKRKGAHDNIVIRKVPRSIRDGQCPNVV